MSKGAMRTRSKKQQHAVTQHARLCGRCNWRLQSFVFFSPSSVTCDVLKPSKTCISVTLHDRQPQRRRVTMELMFQSFVEFVEQVSLGFWCINTYGEICEPIFLLSDAHSTTEISKLL